jgi:hypothetical protein
VVLRLGISETVILPSPYALILWTGTTFTVISCVAVAFRVQLCYVLELLEHCSWQIINNNTETLTDNMAKTQKAKLTLFVPLKHVDSVNNVQKFSFCMPQRELYYSYRDKPVWLFREIIAVVRNVQTHKHTVGKMGSI